MLPGVLTPRLQEEVVHLGAWMPFAQVVKFLLRFRGTDISRSTAQRLTEAAGAAYVAFQPQEMEEIARAAPQPSASPGRLFMSADGAMIPLVGGEWAEVKTLVIGEVQPPVERRGEKVIRTTAHSYFSRLTDAETFQRLALVETHRRGVETATGIGFVTDGAEWLQKFCDQHRPDAVRILDFPHAGEHIAAVGQEVWGQGSESAQTWLRTQLHTRKHQGPESVLTEVGRIVAARPTAPALATHLAYLQKREAHMQYPAFLTAGWPIGDGATESANKLVVEARLKGSGMHWARTHVNPMLALRNIVCGDRWEEAWPQITLTIRQQVRQRRHTGRLRRSALTTPGSASPSLSPPQNATAPALPLPPPPQPSLRTSHATVSATCPATLSQPLPQPRLPWSPPPNHPWRHMPVGRARFKRSPPRDPAKT